MTDKRGSITYSKVDDAYFAARGLRRHAGVGLLWALGVGAVISGQFSGWNLGFAFGGWGGMFIATVIITVMYLGLTYSLAEMSPAMPHTGGAYSFARRAMNIAPDGSELADGNGPFLPMGWSGVLPCLPFAVWLYLAIEQLPLAAEESIDPKRDMPKGILLGMLTLVISAFLVLCLNPAIVGVGAHKLGSSGEPVLDGFKAIYGENTAKVLAMVAVLGLVASFHSIIYAFGRQIYSLSRAGYFPTFLSLTHGTRKTPHVALVAGALVGLSVMLVVWFTVGEAARGAFIGGTLLNMAVFGAMFSYVMQGLSFIRLRQCFPGMERPYRSPFGIPGAALAVVIATVTIYFQLQDPVFRVGVLGVAIWFGVGISYFAVWGRHKLILSPEEEFAMAHHERFRVGADV